MTQSFKRVEQPSSTLLMPQLDDHQSRPLMAKMGRIFRRICSMGEIKRFRRDLRLPLEAQRLTQQAFRLYDNYLSYAVGRMQKKGWRTYCAPGCASCCFAMPAGVTGWEILLIYDQLQQSSQVERFFRRNLESSQVLSRARLQVAGGSSSEEDRDENKRDEMLRAYARLKHPCAFVSNSQECLIYSVRPLACRMHFAFNPPALCDPEHPRFLQSVRLNFSPHTDVQEHIQRLDGHLDFSISDLLAPGLVSLTANIMRFSPISWTG